MTCVLLAGWDAGEVSSPAAVTGSQRRKAQQAVTKYVRHDSSTRLSKAQPPQQQHQQHKPVKTADSLQSPSLLNVKPVKAEQSITTALSRQRGRSLPKGTAAVLQAASGAGPSSVHRAGPHLSLESC